MVFMPSNRFKAALFHLFISGVLVSIVAYIVFFIWYPELHAYVSGVWHIFLILILVDVVLGPFITLVVFNLKKKELRRDLFIVFIAQIAALIYGVVILFSARPVFVVFNADRFDVVYANEFSDDQIQLLKRTEFRSLPIMGPQVIGARLPLDRAKANKIIEGAISGGDDVQNMPELYLNYQSVSVFAGVRARELAELYRYNTDEQQKVDELIDRFSSAGDKIGYLPLKGKLNDLVVIIDKPSGQLLEFSKLKPLSYAYGTDLIDLKKILKKN